MLPVVAFACAIWAGMAVLNAASIALFVSKAGSTAVPLTFTAGGLLTIAAGIVLARLAVRPDRQLTAMRLLVVGSATVTGTIAVGLLLDTAVALSFGAMVWYRVVKAVLPLALWDLANRRFGLAQSKRVYGIVASTQPFGAIAAYAAVPVLVLFLSTEQLLLVAAGALGVAAVGHRVLTAGAPAVPWTAASRSRTPRSQVAILREPMVVPLLAVTALPAAAFTFVVFAFLATSGARFPDTAELASVVSVVFAGGAGLGTLVGSVLATRVLRRFGVAAALAVPAATIGAAAAIAAAFDLAGAGLGAVLAAVIVLRVADDGLTPLADTGRRLLVRAMPAERREVVSTLVDGLATPLAMVLASLVLLGAQLVGAATGAVALLCFVACVGALAASAVVHRGYPVLVRDALDRRELDVDETPLDATALAAVERSLETGSASAVTYSLDLLEHGAPDELPPALVRLLGHPEERVRLDVLDRIERGLHVNFLDAVAQRLPFEGSTLVRGASLRVLAALREADAVDEVAWALTGGEPAVRHGAMVGLLRSGDIESVIAAGEPLLTLVRSADPVDRREAARVLRESGQVGLHRPLEVLVADPDAAVAREALHAAGALGHPRLWVPVAAQLARGEVRAAAQRALEAGGAAALPAVAAALHAVGRSLRHAPLGDPRSLRHAPLGDPRSLRHAPLGDPDVAVALLESSPRLGPDAGAVVSGCLAWALASPDRRVGTAAVRALVRAGHRAVGADAELVRAGLEADLEAIAALSTNRGGIVALGSDGWALALEGRCVAVARRLATGLGPRWAALQDPILGARVIAALDGPSQSEQREYAIEAIETSSPRALALRIAEAVAVADPIAAPGPGATQDPEDSLWALVTFGLDTDPLLAGLALHAAAAVRPRMLAGLVKLVAAHEPAVPALVRQTAELLVHRSPALDPSLTPVEQVLALQGCTAFGEAAAEALAELATRVTERRVAPNDVLFTRGDEPEHLHVVVDGRVELVVANNRSRWVGAGELAGEIAVCGRARHAATAVVRERGTVLAIPSGAVEELLVSSPAVTRALLGRLAHRARVGERGIATTDDAMTSILDRLADTRS